MGFHLYGITMPPPLGKKYEEMVEEACEGGADIIQLRIKGAGPDVLPLAKRLREICHDHHVLFIVNDSAELALTSRADGVHLGQEDMSLAQAREILGVKAVCGKSTHSLEQARAAMEEGADYIAVGPIFPTPTKPDYPPVGLDLIREVKKIASVPFVAIGGIDETNLDGVLSAGAERVAFVRAIFGAEDIRAATRRLKEKVLNATKGVRV